MPRSENTRVFSLRLNAELESQLEEYADLADVSFSEAVRQLLAVGLSDIEVTETKIEGGREMVVKRRLREIPDENLG